MYPLLVLAGFLALPLVEIGVFIAVGSEIGIGWTLALVLLSFVLGIVMLRRQGFSVLKAAQTEARAGIVPERPMIHGAMIVLAAILLMIPGFVTDIFGLLLFIPAVRDLLWKRLRNNIVVETNYSYTASHSAPPDVIDLSQGEFSRRDPSSPWIEDENDSDGRKPL